MKKAWQLLATAVAELGLRDAFVFGGLALVSIGAFMVYTPAGLIVPGATFMWLGLQGREAG